MNIELKPIAESKVRQLGGDVCGVLVRDDSGVMAVSEHGRCTRLDAGVMGPVDGAQGGQGAEVVAWECSGQPGLYDNITRSKGEADHHRKIGRTVRPLVYGDTQPQPAQQGGYPDCDTCGGAMDYMPWHYATKTERHLHACNECWPKVNPAQPAVPEGLPEAIRAIADKLERVEGESADGGYMWDARECAEFIREEADKLATTPKPEGKPDTVYWCFEGSEQDSLETLHKDVRVVISAGTLKGLLDGSPKQGSVPDSVIRQCEDAIQYASEIRGGCISGVREAQKRVRAILDTPQPAQQGIVPKGEDRLTDIYRRKLFECQDALNNLRSEHHNRTAELETEIEDLQEELQRVRRQPAIPEGWRECLREMVQAMHDYEMSVEEDAPYKHRAMMDRAHALLSTTPQADGWVSCEDRLPTYRDSDEYGDVWAMSKLYGVKKMSWSSVRADFESHWMPTGLKRPQPPAEQEGKGDE